MTNEQRALLLTHASGAHIANALDRLLTLDGYLLKIDANERSITCRLAMHLQAELPEWDVDCEYNRDGVDPKRLGHLGLHPNEEDTDAQTVFPDIIVHKRGKGRNFLVIELKKTTNAQDRGVDIAKLTGYRQQLGYQSALFVELTAGGIPAIHALRWIEG